MIRIAALSGRDALAIGVVFAFIVLLLFLKNYRAAVIAVVSVPLTPAVSTLVLAVLGQSFNIMTLEGMAAAVGLIMDDALVMIEQIVRGAPMLDGPAHARVLRAVRELALVAGLSLLGAPAAAFVRLWLTGTDLNIAAMMGLTMTVGIVTEVSVSYVLAVTTAATDDDVAAFVEAG